MSEVVLGRLADLLPEAPNRFDVDGLSVVAVPIGDDVFVINDICSHAQFHLSDGDVWAQDGTIECPKHGALFSLATGEALTLPATRPVSCYPVEIRDGDVTITVSESERDQS